MKKVLIIEKQTPARQLLMQLLKNKPIQLFSVADGSGALELLKKRSFDVIFSDEKGIETLARTGRRPLGTPLIFLKELHEKMRSDVDATLEKPFETSHLEKVMAELSTQNKRISSVIAESPAMKQILMRVEKIAKSHSNIFICGESGTGKEVIASMIHSYSKRAAAPFIRVNCAALPETLIESEFFGHEKGAFTGAHSKRIGRFEMADKGTLLLDEISEIPASLQAKLLRVVQEQEFERVGAAEPIPIDVRLISTSNRNMQEAIKAGHFREDLYYRLNVIPIFLPPLRERVEDILPLAEHFLKEVCQKNQLPMKTFSKKAQQKLLSCKWPGNIRELRNAVEYSVIMDEGEEIEGNHLFFEEPQKLQECVESTLGLPLKEVEKRHILATLKACHDNRTHAANKLGMSVRTLRNKLKEYLNLEA
ncbi:sigma-54-dependent transcriptional regulator [Simkania negevensis]|uniref:Transcriptional regulatory protein flbD n=1 Tax=Simkania negevensis (strain ATCC VR-1471 / DSM 27360 / Z) TaxID=331113 RepID=F8L5L8_SIMNZ|nr:sigma-54 dependent transcriptional regulator [Simkania negevensis]CCB89770.1 transcriptional regulatory protein flbD [Simkania negevensis Z]